MLERPKTAAVIIIGNEILSGKTRDENSHYLAGELRALGVELALVAVIPDIVEEIAGAVAECSRKFDYVFTSGGVGPTHDDVTFEGVARAFGVGLVENGQLMSLITRKCGEALSKTAVRMALLPEGAELVEMEGMNFPPVQIRNVYVFPGVPEFLRAKFHRMKERFRQKPFYIKRVYLEEDECRIADALSSTATEFGGVEIGSYPKSGNDGFRVLVTMESRDEETLKRAFNKLLSLLPSGIVVKIE